MAIIVEENKKITIFVSLDMGCNCMYEKQNNPSSTATAAIHSIDISIKRVDLDTASFFDPT